MKDKRNYLWVLAIVSSLAGGVVTGSALTNRDIVRENSLAIAKLETNYTHLGKSIDELNASIRTLSENIKQLSLRRR